MILTIITTTETIDEWGNITITETETNYTIDSRDFQPVAGITKLADSQNITNDGLLKNRFRKLFLKEQLKDISIDIGQKIKVDGKEYTVVELSEYEKHKEVICYVVE